MNKKSLVFTTLILFLIMILGISTVASARPQQAPAELQSSLPTITFLGEGPGTFTVDPPLMLLVKTYVNGEFLFVTADSNTYQAARSERVWSTNFMPAESIRLFDEERSYGNVEQGCVVNFVQIEDNVDTRRNSFYVNGNLILTVDQGMVTYGSFTVPETGELTFFAEDSVGLVIELCLSQATETPGAPSETPTGEITPNTPPAATVTVTEPAVTETVEVTLTATVPPVQVPSETPTATTAVTETDVPGTTPTITPTVPDVPGQQVTPTPTATAPGGGPTASPTATVPGVAVTVTPTVSGPTATATLVPTPAGGIPLSGGVPGPREIAWIGFGLMAALIVVAGAWWRLMRWYRNGK